MEKKKQRIQDSILFLGNRDDVYRLYQAMDVFVLPSRYEGLPVVGVEAQAAGLPCVLSDKMTEETKMTENAGFLSIDDGIDNWADVVPSKMKFQRNASAYRDIRKAGFSINERANRLTEFYKGVLE